MTTPLPDSLGRFGEQLERAVERDVRAARRRRGRQRIAVRMMAATAAAVAIAVVALSLPSDDDATFAPPGVATASAAERAAEVLTAAPESILHVAATYRQVGPDGGISTWREETWRQTSRPYARRELTTLGGGVVIETATVGDRPASLYDPTTDTIYKNSPGAGPALGTPMPANDGDPLRKQMIELLRSGDARAVKRSRADGHAAISFAYENPLPDGSAVQWRYVVDAETYQPLRLTSVSPDGARLTARFETYDALEATEATRALLNLRAQHPDATVDRTEAGYQAAQARLYAEPIRH
jgi:hypothetical protein